MKYLCFDTSTDRISATLADNDKPVSSISKATNRNMITHLVPALEKLLDKNYVDFSELRHIAVGLGPGSFTSLKIGLAAAKAICFARQIPILGVSTLDIIAQAVKAEHITVVCDARRNMVYTAQYSHIEAKLKRLTDYSLVSLEAINKSISNKTIYTGSAAGLIQTSKKIKIAKESSWIPQSKNMPALVYDRIKTNKFDQIDQLAPLYLYKEDCQVTKK